MAIQNVTDLYKMVQTAGDTYVGNSSNQIYSINPYMIGAGETITIVDTGGDNVIELMSGLTIASSLFLSNETQLTLSNGAVLDIRGADTFTFNVSGDASHGVAGVDNTFAEFAAEMGLAELPGEGEGIASGNENVVIGDADPVMPPDDSTTVALTADTTGVDGVAENFTYDINSSTGNVISQLNSDIELSGFKLGEDSLTFIDVANGTVSTNTFVENVVTSGSTIKDETDIIFDANASGNMYQLIINGVVDESLDSIDFTVS